MTPTPPPGWYTDPSNAAGHRWWDGTQWTQHVSAGQPAQQAEAVATGAPAATSYTAPGYGAPGDAGYGAPGYGTPGYGAPGYGAPGYGAPGYGPAQGPMASGNRTLAAANRYTLITLGVVALYVLLAITTRIVFIGVFPVLMSVRALQAKEKFAPAALVAAIIAVVVAFSALSGH